MDNLFSSLHRSVETRIGWNDRLRRRKGARLWYFTNWRLHGENQNLTFKIVPKIVPSVIHGEYAWNGSLFAFNHLVISCSSVRIQFTCSKHSWFLCPLYHPNTTFKVACPAYVAIMFILLAQCATWQLF